MEGIAVTKRFAPGLVALAILAAAPACLDRGDAEQFGYSTHVLAAGTRVPKAADDEALAMRVMSNAGASGPLVPLHTGFVAGSEVLYWDFGASTSSVEPVWILQRDGEPVDHPPLVDSLPGDASYSPFRAVFTVEVTEAYRGERLTSLAALEDAIALGLVEEPVATNTYVSWPIVPADFALERRGDEPLGTRELYGTGVSARYLPIRDEAAPFERSVATGTAYALRRQNESSPLDESARGADLNADGDQLDSNLIFERGVDDPMQTGLWMISELTMPSDYAFGAYRADSDLFARDEMDAPIPVPDTFIERAEQEDPVYLPLYALEEP